MNVSKSILLNWLRRVNQKKNTIVNTHFIGACGTFGLWSEQSGCLLVRREGAFIIHIYIYIWPNHKECN